MTDAKSFFENVGKDAIQAQIDQNNSANLDQQIDRKMQIRELNKLRFAFYDQLKQYYSTRKYKEVVTLGCAERCLISKQAGASFREDNITNTENVCLQNCFHKYYRYLAYSNTLYTYLVNDDGKVDTMLDGGDQDPQDFGEEGEGSELDQLKAALNAQGMGDLDENEMKKFQRDMMQAQAQEPQFQQFKNNLQ